MKTIALSVFFIFTIALSAFCGGDLELVNTQEMKLDNIINVKILYSSERISVYMGTTDTLVIKEYMNENNEKYFAKINNTGNTITIENGNRPFRPIFNFFSRRLEVYLPVSYKNTMSIKTSSGNIETSDIFCSDIIIESSSGRISADSITSNKINLKTSSGRIDVGNAGGNISVESSSGRISADSITSNKINLKTSSGRIDVGNAGGNISVESSSGRIEIKQVNGMLTLKTTSGNIELGMVAGSVNAKTSSGRINCTVNENAGDITFNTSSGAVRLYLPQSLSFNFSSRTSSGRLTTPFSDRLSNPVNDRNLTQGIIGNNSGSGSIPKVDIRTSSGSISIEWK